MRLALILLFSTTLFISCDKQSKQAVPGIPYVPVNQKVNINDPKYQSLQNIGGWAYVVGGSRGIILYRESTESFKAYERQCTYDPIQVCSTLDMDAAVLQANDYDCCGSVFNILNGGISQGPASKALLQYQTSFDGTTVTITN